MAKEINFAICFGMGPWVLARKINELKENRAARDLVGDKTLQSYIQGFDLRFPKNEGHP